MKRQILNSVLVLLCFFSIGTITAQMTIEKVKNGQYGTPEERANEASQKMKQGFNLTNAQMIKIEDINLRYAIRAENEVAKVKMSNWSKYWKIKSIQADKDKELKPILTAEQFKKYAQKRDEMMWEGAKAILF
jgi:hypothetical protein